MLLELTRDGALDRPVTRVVWAHCQLVDEHSGWGIEHLHREHAHHAELTRDPQPDLLRRDRMVGKQTRRGCDHFAADAVGLNRSDDRVGSGLPVRAACDQDRELSGKRDRFLGEQWTRAGQRIVGPDPPDTATVVATAWRLQHHVVRAEGLSEVADLVAILNDAPPRARNAEFGQPSPHHDLVLCMPQGIGAGS